jgi:predicted nucleic acid-binding protein
MNIIIDTNIIFSSLIKEKNILLDFILHQDEHALFSPNLSVIEIFNHEEKIMKATSLSTESLSDIYSKIISRLFLYNENNINSDCYLKALNLCIDIDINDIPFVALTIELDGYLLTGDKKLKDCLQKKGFNKFFEILNEQN